jgi:Zn-finger nucleic acid-binding protein
MSGITADVVVCPRDGTELVEVERNGVLVDACPLCRGIWLDRGELERLVAHERAPASDDFLDEVSGWRAPGEHEAEEVKRDEVDRKRKRGGFLENFLDFGGD